MAVTRRLKDANDVSELAIATTQLTGGSNGDFLVRQGGDWSGASPQVSRSGLRLVYIPYQVACTAVDGALPRTDDWEEVFRWPSPGGMRLADVSPPVSAWVKTPADEPIDIDIRVDGTSIFAGDTDTLTINASANSDNNTAVLDTGAENTQLVNTLSVHVRLDSGATGGAGLIITLRALIFS